MAFPTTLKNFISKLTGGVTEASHINDLQDEVSALETKVGVDGSAVTTSLDYLVKNTASVNPGHKHTLAGALNDVAITSPTNGQALAYNTATSKWENTNAAVSDASPAVKGVTKLSVAPAVADDPVAVGTNDARLSNASYANKGIVRLDTSSSFSGLNVSGGIISVNAGTGANQIVKLDGTGRLPAVDGSQLTNTLLLFTPSNNLKSSSDTQINIPQRFASSSFTRQKEIVCYSSGTIRTSFVMGKSDTNTFLAGIYKNGVAFGTLRSPGTTGETTYTEDLYVSAGDLIQLYVDTGFCGSTGAYIKNFRVLYDLVPSSNSAVIL